jgi:hypothetical protein
MRAAVSILWFLTAFLTGAILYAAIRPGVPPRPIGFEQEDLFDRCRQAGACGEPGTPSPGPPLPVDIDRA